MRPTPRLPFPIPLLLIALFPAGLLASQEESNYVKLLKKAPESRMVQVVDIIGKRGDANDLTYLFQRATRADGFPAAVRLKVLEVLADAASSRKVRPGGSLDDLASLLKSSAIDPPSKVAAIRLAGLWKVESTVADLANLARSRLTDPLARAAGLDALAEIGGGPARKAIDDMATAGPNPAVQAMAVAALAKLDLDAASDRAAALMAGAKQVEDVAPFMAAFIDRQGGAEKLAAALGRKRPGPDGARLALRSLYALGRSDESLVRELSAAAGIDAEAKAPTKEVMDALVADVTSRGNSARGEAIFRRPDMNCMNCHALSGASGGVGPELSSLGLSSPVDYVVYSILVPDQSIKEEYQTKVVLTDDGRVLQGIVVEEDDKHLVLKDAAAEVRTIPASSVEDTKRGGSLMPKGLANMLTRDEFVDLVRFLSELGKPGPYALKSTPTIQRWRVLRSTPEGLARFVPDAEAFKGQVLDADADRWAPAYAWVDGHLPTAELAEITGGKVCYLQGEINVSAAGPVTFRLDGPSGLAAWLDDKPVPADMPTAEVGPGRHKLTLRVDTSTRGDLPVRVEVSKPAGSPAQFSVVGGR